MLAALAYESQSRRLEVELRQIDGLARTLDIDSDDVPVIAEVQDDPLAIRRRHTLRLSIALLGHIDSRELKP